jgi:transmembrane sensor
VIRTQPVPRRRVLSWAGGAIAASLVMVAGVQVFQTRAQPYAVETAAGQTREIALADGSKVALNGGTRLLVDRADAREVTLERGEALFTVAHDDSDPFMVRAGGAEIVDLGTVFNVVREPGETRVAVSEGLVAYNPKAENVRLSPGQTLVDAGGMVRVGRAEAADIGGWRTGRLVYDGAPLGAVAADLARATGTRVSVDPSIAARPFTGVIALPADRAGFVAGIGPLLDVEVRTGTQGATLSPMKRVAP